MNEKPYIEFFTDGAARGKNGSSYSFVCLKNGEMIWNRSEELPNKTSSCEAEYIAVISAMKYARNKKFKNVIINTDSESIVEQMNGRSKVKSKSSKPHFRTVKHLNKFVNAEFRHVPRCNVYTGFVDGLCDCTLESTKYNNRKY